MNGRCIESPEKHKSNEIAKQNESILYEMEIKQEPTIKQETGVSDEILMMSRSAHTAIGSLHNSIGGTEVNYSNVSFDFYGLDDVKSNVKIEKVKYKANQIPRKNSDENKRPQSNVNKRFPIPKSSESDDGATKKSSAKFGKSGKANSFGSKKVTAEGKANGKRHMRSLCDYQTSNENHMKRHMLKHTGERPFPCSVCQKRFTRKQHLQSHIKTHVNEFLFSCAYCLQGFHRSDEKVENETGCKVRRYECHLCKEFSTLDKKDFKRHLRVHTGDRPLECDQCSKKFNHPRTLERHRKSHANPRPLKIKCSTCFKNFAKQKKKEDHEANCKRRGYRCDLCKSYTTDGKTHLIEHMRIHTGEKPFRCEICSKCFSQKVSPNRHQKIHKSLSAAKE